MSSQLVPPAVGATSPGPNYAILAIVLGLAWVLLQKIWLGLVNEEVPEPYLDEYFHVRQAQLYCAGNFSYWDPKITTPPGLYLVSYVLHCFGRACDLAALRKKNQEILAIAVFVPLLFLFLARNHAKEQLGLVHTTVPRSVARALHGAINISLFPPLFFFSSLYYTDIASTACVVFFLQLRESDTLAVRPFLGGNVHVLVGLVALCFRQTNIFWVVVFPAALDVVSALQSQSRKPSSSVGSGSDVPSSFSTVAEQSWKDGIIHDPPSDAAYIEDYFKLSLSIVLSTLRSPLIAFQTLLPYIVLLAAFGAFVLLNGGVVLGDRANHVATIHIPQMLYIWPYIFFFSWQMIIPRIRALISPAHLLPDVFKRFRPRDPRESFPRLFTAVGFLAVALVAVRYNTIVHPFTLADNRHYVFYVFRILLRHPAIKYLATPGYVICGWAALYTLGLPPRNASNQAKPAEGSESKPNGAEVKDEYLPYTAERGCRTSYVLAWLLSTTLCLITAPLVEPRYVIIPWITWRLGVASLPYEEVPSSASSTTDETPQQPPKPRNQTVMKLGNFVQALNHGEHRLYVETVWFMVVNAVTAYMFLYRGYEWPQEPGAVQRFMW